MYSLKCTTYQKHSRASHQHHTQSPYSHPGLKRTRVCPPSLRAHGADTDHHRASRLGVEALHLDVLQQVGVIPTHVRLEPPIPHGLCLLLVLQRCGVGGGLDHSGLLGRVGIDAHDGCGGLGLENVRLLEHARHLELVALGTLSCSWSWM